MMILIGLITGLALGLTGGGGSLLAVPMLVYLADMPMTTAVPVALIIVAGSALVGTLEALKYRLLYLTPLMLFSIGAGLATPVGIYIGNWFEDATRLLLFSALAVVIAIRTVRNIWLRPDKPTLSNSQDPEHGPVCRFATPGWSFRFGSLCSAFLVGAGIMTGLASGFFGVGGGFLIVPALMFLSQMSMRHAVANSLAIITLMGLSSTVSSYAVLSETWQIWSPYLAMGAVGMLVGRIAARHIPVAALQGTFGVVLFFTAILTGYLTLIR
ncbi:MAG TPA: sulfite exporter TauE/SafE family protein [Oceanospirillales bacterium]|nr:permease [Oceanospirillaceae bacterium]HBS42104.1 sulfite exporter TauE/SafE family protein [Oceanospirillales bacterium]|tara:strand:- start:3466 stop:4275 length:810 start_codon:yes stop_codon:yes gene_type:complete